MKLKTYCLSRSESTDNIGLKKITMTNKAIREISNCILCLSDKSRFLKQKK